MEPAQPRTAGLLAGLAGDHPALVAAQRVTAAAAAVGFDWDGPAAVRVKVDEEVAELDAAIRAGDHAAVHEELGDLLFTVVNLARHLGVPAEQALHDATRKFESRFGRVERMLASDGRSVAAASVDELEAAWQRAKAEGVR